MRRFLFHLIIVCLLQFFVRTQHTYSCDPTSSLNREIPVGYSAYNDGIDGDETTVEELRDFGSVYEYSRSTSGESYTFYVDISSGYEDIIQFHFPDTLGSKSWRLSYIIKGAIAIVEDEENMYEVSWKAIPPSHDGIILKTNTSFLLPMNSVFKSVRPVSDHEVETVTLGDDTFTYVHFTPVDVLDIDEEYEVSVSFENENINPSNMWQILDDDDDEDEGIHPVTFSIYYFGFQMCIFHICLAFCACLCCRVIRCLQLMTLYRKKGKDVKSTNSVKESYNDISILEYGYLFKSSRSRMAVAQLIDLAIQGKVQICVELDDKSFLLRRGNDIIDPFPDFGRNRYGEPENVDEDDEVINLNMLEDFEMYNEENVIIPPSMENNKTEVDNIEMDSIQLSERKDEGIMFSEASASENEVEEGGEEKEESSTSDESSEGEFEVKDEQEELDLEDVVKTVDQEKVDDKDIIEDSFLDLVFEEAETKNEILLETKRVPYTESIDEKQIKEHLKDHKYLRKEKLGTISWCVCCGYIIPIFNYCCCLFFPGIFLSFFPLNDFQFGLTIGMVNLMVLTCAWIGNCFLPVCAYFTFTRDSYLKTSKTLNFRRVLKKVKREMKKDVFGVASDENLDFDRYLPIAILVGEEKKFLKSLREMEKKKNEKNIVKDDEERYIFFRSWFIAPNRKMKTDEDGEESFYEALLDRYLRLLLLVHETPKERRRRRRWE